MFQVSSRAQPHGWAVVAVGGVRKVVEEVTSAGTGTHLERRLLPEPTPRTNKQRCDLCLMWFEASSVDCVVPRKRLLDLQANWGIVQPGRRYNIAGFIYSSARVCKLCAQWFDDPVKELTATKSDFGEEMSPFYTPRSSQSDHSPRFSLGTLPRRNIAISDHADAYMSSEVDGMGAEMAIKPPYIACSRTRREENPWWEVDLGGLFHLHGIHFRVAQLHGKYKQLETVDHTTKCWLFLLAEPSQQSNLDDSNPSILARSQFEIDFSKGVEEPGSIRHPLLNSQQFEYAAPKNAAVRAVRIQLVGVTTLTLRSVEIFQGNTEYSRTMRRESRDGASGTSLSLGSPSPTTRATKTRTSASKRQLGKTQRLPVRRLVDGAHSTYTSIQEWITRCKAAVHYLNVQQLQVLRDVVFLPCKREGTESFAMVQDLLHHSVLMAQRPQIQRDVLVERLRRVSNAASDYAEGVLPHRDKDMLPLLHDELLMVLFRDDTLAHIEMNLLADSQPPWQSTMTINSEHQRISWAQFLLGLNVFVDSKPVLRRNATPSSRPSTGTHSRLSRTAHSRRRLSRSITATSLSAIQAKLDEMSPVPTAPGSRSPVDQRPHTVVPIPPLSGDDRSMLHMPASSSVETRPVTMGALTQDSTTSFFGGQQEIYPSNRPSMRSCDMCRASFHKKSLQPVIRNHLIQWLRARGVEQRSRYEEGSALFDFVQVCVFCAQMFDPSFDQGFWHPVESQTSRTTTSHYFDDQYPYSASLDNAEYMREMEGKRALARRLVMAARTDASSPNRSHSTL